MRLKTFTTKTMPEALRLIKEDLGKDAIILSTRKIKQNGTPALEITAAIDKPAADVPLRTTKPIDFNAVKEEVDASTLIQHGVDSTLADTIQAAQKGLTAAQFSPTEALEMVLAKRLDLPPLTQTFTAGRVHVFVGPHGAGKTTCVGKVAVWGKKGKKTVGLLTLDGQKIGGVEPLHVLADALGDEVHLVENIEDLRTAGEKLGKRQLLLVDTPGLNPYDGSAIRAFAEKLKTMAKNPVVHILLPANSSLPELKNTLTAFQPLKPQDVIFTKTDASASLGNAVNVLTMNLPAGGMTHSPDMADAPAPLHAQMLAAHLSTPPKHVWAQQEEGDL